MTRPPAALVHDELWRGPIGAGRKKLYRLEEPDTRCRACSSEFLDPVVHHLTYEHFTGAEPREVLVWLCPKCHRVIHFRHDYRTWRTHIPAKWGPTFSKKWRAQHRRRDPWPYKKLARVTRWYIRRRWLIRVMTYGNDRVRYSTPRRSER
jgi:hypothetical protein